MACAVTKKVRGFGGVVIISVLFDLFGYSGCRSRFDPAGCNGRKHA